MLTTNIQTSNLKDEFFNLTEASILEYLIVSNYVLTKFKKEGLL